MQLIDKDKVIPFTDEQIKKIGEDLDKYYKTLPERVARSNKAIREIFDFHKEENNYEK